MLIVVRPLQRRGVVPGRCMKKPRSLTSPLYYLKAAQKAMGAVTYDEAIRPVACVCVKP